MSIWQAVLTCKAYHSNTIGPKLTSLGYFTFDTKIMQICSVWDCEWWLGELHGRQKTDIYALPQAAPVSKFVHMPLWHSLCFPNLIATVYVCGNAHKNVNFGDWVTSVTGHILYVHTIHKKAYGYFHNNAKNDGYRYIKTCFTLRSH